MWRRRRSDEDFSNEIRANIEIEADRLIAGGMSEGDAHAAARRAFGNVALVQERFYESTRVLLFVAAIRDAVRRAEPGLLVNDMTTMPGRLARDTMRERVVAYLSSSFAVLTLLLASLGIYGVLSCEVTRRTKEIGVRAALGAQRSEVTLLILGEGIGMTAAGLVVGLAGAGVLARYLQGMLFGVSALSFSAFAIVPLVFLAVAAAAAYLPARRAMRVDPMVALRYE